MTLDITRVIIDFGLVVLVWLVQIIIYPGFKYYSLEGLNSWHRKYTRMISLVVFPLMTSQLAIGIYQVVSDPTWTTVAMTLMIVSTWLMTFFLFVPYHNKIAAGRYDVNLLETMVRMNWFRTLSWTMIFVLNVLANT